MKAEVIKVEEQHLIKDLPDDTLFYFDNGFYCPHCRERLTPTSSIEAFRNCLDKKGKVDYDYKRSIGISESIYLLGPCKCGHKLFVTPNRVEKYLRKDKLFKKHPEFKGAKVANLSLRGYYNRRDGVSINREKGNVSLFSLSNEVFVPRYIKTRYFFKKIVDRFTVNVKTGAVYVYSSENKSILRVNWNTPGLVPCCSDDLIVFFANKVFELMGLPLMASQKKEEEKGRVVLSCGETAVEYENGWQLLADLTGILSAPNVYIVKDGYTGVVRFRDGAMNVLGRRFDKTCNESMLTDPSVYTPVGKNYRRLQPRDVLDGEEYINYMIENLNIPKSRQFKKLYRANPMVMGWLSYCMEVGIKKDDNLWKMIDFLRAQPSTFYTKEQGKEIVKPFLRAMVKTSGETIVANRLIRPNTRRCGSYKFDVEQTLLFDTASMYRTHKGVVSLAGHIRDIHDNLSLILAKEKSENKPIVATKEEKRRCREYGDYKIEVAEDLYRLDDISARMHICVGGGCYDEPALNHSSTIYYMVDGSGKYEACIELAKNWLVQAKGYCNRSLDGKVAETIVQWVKDCKIAGTEKCVDFRNLKSNLEYQAAS